ncbi:hypothetical protein QBC33DRAFT_209266 [Phialemonium atrogriseum]|uniref:Uncharacterized protein n=1 Tax=Phialemonium atrogriseum TaxID=1093897 RepID=A0AAJ0BTX0_9PEZI|nr:uncharacterized protein QBC33DRAFT_209266 [Phialemonium atrogriseum]KAK1764146.1 hypothetical protein QBC33DRAFT_209266 [Phialemonium atrogriseum]
MPLDWFRERGSSTLAYGPGKYSYPCSSFLVNSLHDPPASYDRRPCIPGACLRPSLLASLVLMMARCHFGLDEGLDKELACLGDDRVCLPDRAFLIACFSPLVLLDFQHRLSEPSGPDKTPSSFFSSEAVKCVLDRITPRLRGFIESMLPLGFKCVHLSTGRYVTARNSGLTAGCNRTCRLLVTSAGGACSCCDPLNPAACTALSSLASCLPVVYLPHLYTTRV